MFNLQGSEIIVILLLALVVLGPEKLPEAIRRFGKTYAELKKMGSGFQSELKSALDEPMREMRETADMVRDAADPHKIQAETDAARARALEQQDEAVPPVAAEPNGADPHPPETEPDLDPGTTVATPDIPKNRIAAANASFALQQRAAPPVQAADAVEATDQPERLDDADAPEDQRERSGNEPQDEPAGGGATSP